MTIVRVLKQKKKKFCASVQFAKDEGNIISLENNILSRLNLYICEIYSTCIHWKNDDCHLNPSRFLGLYEYIFHLNSLPSLSVLHNFILKLTKRELKEFKLTSFVETLWQQARQRVFVKMLLHSTS